MLTQETGLWKLSRKIQRLISQIRLTWSAISDHEEALLEQNASYLEDLKMLRVFLVDLEDELVVWQSKLNEILALLEVVE
jgi:hypothetical protein